MPVQNNDPEFHFHYF